MSEREVSLDEDGRTSDWDRTSAIMNAIDAASERGEITWLARRGRHVAAIVPALWAEIPLGIVDEMAAAAVRRGWDVTPRLPEVTG